MGSTQDNSVLHEKWVQEYGHTIKYTMLLGVRSAFILDRGPQLTLAIPVEASIHHGYQGVEPRTYEQL